MEKLRITGGRPLIGTVTVSGAKNAAVAILPASLISRDESVIENLPCIDDVLLLKTIIEQLGARVEYECNPLAGPGRMTIHPTLTGCTVNYDLVRRMRASYYLLGALLARDGKAEVALPGGCDIGPRPIDLHIKGLRALGAKVSMEYGIITAEAPAGGLTGAEIYLDIASVGATINIMMAATTANGTTIISNAAKEPHVVDVANFLNCMGASVRGAGTETIRINGVERLHGCNYAIIPDQIEAGTYMIAAAATRGDVIIRNVIPTHLEAISAKLMEMGVNVIEGDDGNEFFMHVINERARCRPVNLHTLPYPGFPTDLQQPLMTLSAISDGTSVLVEGMFEDRFKHVPYLERMGARIKVSGNVALVEGVTELMGCEVTATDLRAGAALVVAALCAKGTTEITGIKYIDRGYECIEHKLGALGAQVQRIPPRELYALGDNKEKNCVTG